MAGSPFDWLVGHEDDAWPKPEKPATPLSRTTRKPQHRQSDSTRLKQAQTRQNLAINQKTQPASHKKRNAVPQANQPKTKTNSDSLMVTASNPNPTG